MVFLVGRADSYEEGVPVIFVMALLERTGVPRSQNKSPSLEPYSMLMNRALWWS